MKDTGKYLLFTVATDQLGVPIQKVREIIRYEKLTPVRDTENYVRGVINLRGKIIPVVDLRMKFGMEREEYTDKTVFIIADVVGENGVYNVGLAVDGVQEVVRIEGEEIQEPPAVGLQLKGSYVQGLAQVKEQMVLLLDLDAVMGSTEILALVGHEKET